MHRLVLAAALVCASGACDVLGTGPGRASDNRAPVAVGEIAPLALWWLEADMDIAVSPYVRDPDGDSLTFAATLVSGSGPATRPLPAYGDFVVLRPIAAQPTATVVVTASDPGGLTAQQRFGVTVEVLNSPVNPSRPLSTAPITATQIRLGRDSLIDLHQHFTGPWLSFHAWATSGRVGVSIVNDTLRLRGREVGTARVTVTASNQTAGGPVEQRFDVVVAPAHASRNRPPALLEGLNSKLVPPGFRFRQGVSAYFADPDGDVLAFRASSTEPERAAVTLVGGAVAVEAKAPGTAAILVTATDPGGLPGYGGIKVVIR